LELLFFHFHYLQFQKLAAIRLIDGISKKFILKELIGAQFSFVFFSPFPTVAESIQKELDEYRASEEEVKRLKNVMVGYQFYLLVSPQVKGIITCYVKLSLKNL